MNVLHLYAGNLYGGVEALLVTIARLRELAPEMKPAYGLCFRGRLWDELSATGVPLHDLGPVRLSRPWTVWRARRQLRKLIQTQPFDVVVCHSLWPHTVFAPTVRSLGIRLVTFFHDAVSHPSRLDRWAARTRPDRIIANSHFTAGTVPKLFPGVPVDVLHLPVEQRAIASGETVRHAMRKELQTADDAVVVLQASRLERWKGPDIFVEALGQLQQVPGWVGWLAGGPQKGDEDAFLQELRQRATTLGIADRLRFLGQRSDVPQLMRTADIYCQPNRGPEPFGISFVEALAAGLPVVSTRHGGAAEIVDESCGVLVPPGEAKPVAAALRHLIGDANTRSRLAAAAPQRAATISDPARQIPTLARFLAAG